MQDPTQQKKGGFGAFAAREHERYDVHAVASVPDATSGTTPATDERAAAAPDASRADEATGRPGATPDRDASR